MIKVKQMLATGCCFLMAAVCVACASNPNETVGSDQKNTQTESVSTQETPYDYLPSQVDCDGKTYSIWARNDGHMSALSGVEIFVEEPGAEAISQAVYARNTEVMERYDVDIKVTTNNSTNIMNGVYKAVNSGDQTYSLVWLSKDTASILPIYRALYDWNSLPYVDTMQPWWNQTATKNLTVAGRNFLQLNYIAYSGILETHCFYFNKNLTDAYQIGSVYDYVKDGTWTLDTLTMLSRNIYDDADRDQLLSTGDTYGFLTSFGSCNVFTYSCNQPFLTIEDDYSVTLEIYSDKMVDIVNRVYALVYNNGGTYAGGVAEEAELAKMFANGQAMFYAGFLSDSLLYLRDFEEYGILPFPKYNEDQEEYITSISGGTGMLGVPANIAEPEFVGMISEALAITSYEHVYPAVFKTVMVDKFSRDDQYAEMYDLLMNRIEIQFAMISQTGDSGCANVLWQLLEKGTTNLASYYQSIAEPARAHYEQIIKALVEGTE